MEVRVLKAFMFGGKPVQPDAIIDMPVADAHYVIGLKRAEAIVESTVVEAPNTVRLKVRKAK